MSVKKHCFSCKHYSHGECIRDGSLMCGKEMKYWELSDDAKADLLHDAEPEHDAVNHPSHYTQGGIECIDALKAATTGLYGIEAVCTANAIKYLWRWKHKNGIQDIDKAIWYLERLKKELSNDEE